MSIIVSSRFANAFNSGMEAYCEREKIDYLRVINNRISRPYPVTNETDKDVVFSYHTIGYNPGLNIFHYKPGYIPDTLFVDQFGFSATALVCRFPQVVDNFCRSNTDIESSIATIRKMSVESNRSKIDKTPRDDRKLCDTKYILFAGQVPRDSVIRYSRFGSSRKTLNAVLPELDKLGITILFRPHPRAKKSGQPDIDEYLGSFKNIHLFNESCSIHQAIEQSMGVISINSGVGFEALVHGKPVFTLGKCDYDYATHRIARLGDIRKIPDLLSDNRADRAHKYLHYHLCNSVVFSADKQRLADNMISYARRALKRWPLC